MMKNAFYFMLKALFVLEIFTFLSSVFGYVGKRLHKKTMINFKIYGLTDWKTNIYNVHITQYLKKQRLTDNEIWSVNRIQNEEYFS